MIKMDYSDVPREQPGENTTSKTLNPLVIERRWDRKSGKRKDKNPMLRNVVWGILVLAVLAAALWGLRFLNASEAAADAQAQKGSIFVNVPVQQVESITVDNYVDNAHLEFCRQDQALSGQETDNPLLQWRLRGHEQADMDLSRIGNFVGFTAVLSAQQMVAEQATPAQLEEYGLGSPRARMQVAYQDGNRINLILGAEVPGGTQGYIMVEGDPNVYMGAPGYGLYMLRTEKDYVSTDRIRFSGDAFTYLHYVRPSDGQEVELRMEAADDAGMLSYRMLEPYRMGVDFDVITQLQKALSAISVQQTVEMNAKDLQKYGLAPARGWIRMQDEWGSDYTLYVGEAQDELYTYIKIEGDPNVYTVYTSALDFMNRDAAHMVDRYILIAHLDTVDKIKMDATDTGDSFTMSVERKPVADKSGEPGNAQKVEEKFLLDGAEVDADDFKALYHAIISMELDGPAEKELDVKAPAVIRIKMERGGGREDLTYELIPYDFDRYAVRDNAGNCSFVMLRDHPDRVWNMVERMRNGLKPREHDNRIIITGDD